MAFNNERSLTHSLDLQHVPPRPHDVDSLAEWLEDATALDEAEVWRFIRPGLMHEIYRDEAMAAADTVLHDVSRGYYEVDESYRRFLLKRTGEIYFSVVEQLNSRHESHVGGTALRACSG